MLRALIYLVAGAMAGSLLGYLNQCAGGSCPLLCIWWRGAIFGAVAGLALYWAGPAGTPKSRSTDPK